MGQDDNAHPEPAKAEPAGSPLSYAEFSRLFREHAGSLWLLAAGLVHIRSDADDVLQEASLQAVKRLPEFERDSNFRAWLAQFVRYVAANQNRHRHRERVRQGGAAAASIGPGLSEPAVRTTHSGPSPIDRHGGLLADQEAFEDHVIRALNVLDPVARACLLLRSVGGLSFRELATLLDIPEGTAMSHVFRARGTLLRMIKPESAAAATFSKEPGDAKGGAGDASPNRS